MTRSRLRSTLRWEAIRARTNSSLLSTVVDVSVLGALVWLLGAAVGAASYGWGWGPGCDLAEEPVDQGEMPVTQAMSRPWVSSRAPSTSGSLGVGEELAVDGVADATFERP
jgi:hypothetical protein